MYDPDTKLLRFEERDYNPIVGRWTAKDPTLFASGDTNLYAYAFNDPVSFYDHTGLEDTADGGSELTRKVGEATIETCEKVIHAKGDQMIEQWHTGEKPPLNLNPITGSRLNETVETYKPGVFENSDSTWNLWQKIKNLWITSTNSTSPDAGQTACKKCQKNQAPFSPSSQIQQIQQAPDAGQWDPGRY